MVSLKGIHRFIPKTFCHSPLSSRFSGTFTLSKGPKRFTVGVEEWATMPLLQSKRVLTNEFGDGITRENYVQLWEKLLYHTTLFAIQGQLKAVACVAVG